MPCNVSQTTTLI